MISNSAKIKKKKGPSGTVIALVCFFVFVVVLFIVLAFHSHIALGSEAGAGKIFINSRLNPFRHSSVLGSEHRLETGPSPSVGSQPIIEEPAGPSHNELIINEEHKKESRGVVSAGPPAHPSHPANSPPNLFDARSLPADTSYYRLNCAYGHLMSYWKPTTEFDRKWKSPFAVAGAPEKYVTFEPDVGGWNNIRMQMELVLVFAYATGRTLVLPPDQPMYLLNKGKGHQKAHSFADFFPFEKVQERMKVITMEEFLAREAVTGNLRRNDSTVMYPPGNKTIFIGTERDERLAMWAYVRQVTTCPQWKGLEQFLVIPFSPDNHTSDPKQLAMYDTRRTAFAANRSAQFYDAFWQEQKVIHFISKPEWGYRLLEHFYSFIHFDDPVMERLFKRFVRDLVHYQREIFCKSALVVNKLLQEGNGSYIAFHIRRGEFQYKIVKISAEKMVQNLKAVLPRDQLVFVATDERNKTFFDAFKRHFKTVRFLDDYMVPAGLTSINPNYLGMVDQVVCTRGTYFVGTWFSTFSGYITRMRGYMGYNDNSTFFGDIGHRDRYQQWEDPKFPFYMREFPTAWAGIDEI